MHLVSDLNLNNNKVNLDSKLEYFESNEKKKALLEESKNLIDDLYDKNKIITAKLIKYKQICESNNITVGNSNASTFY